MSRKHGMGWDNGNIVPIGKNLKSHSGRYAINEQKRDEGKDIIIEVDGNTFSNEDFRHIQNLGGIIGHDEQLKEEELPCEFGLGGLKITINSLDSFEQELINL